MYLNRVRASVGDWGLYYEPGRGTADGRGRGGRLAYFATFRLDRIEPDPTIAHHYYVFLSDYLAFDRAVPFREGEATFERVLTKDNGTTNRGAFGRSVRSLSDREYDLILRAGFTRTLGHIEPALGKIGDQPRPTFAGFAESEPAAFERPIVERLVTRPFREAAFAGAVMTAYSDTCAMTGLKIVNGGGRTEAQAAHIRPVASGGTDSVRNGVALSGTLHWIFDRGLISIDDDYSLLISKRDFPDPVRRMLNPDLRIRMPVDPSCRPDSRFLAFHRENVFKK